MPAQSMLTISSARSTYLVPKPPGGRRTLESFSEAEKQKLRPIAETRAMLDQNAFFPLRADTHYEQYLPEADAIYKANGGDKG